MKSQKDSFSEVLNLMGNNVGNSQSGAHVISPDQGRFLKGHYHGRLTNHFIDQLTTNNEFVERIVTTIPKQSNKKSVILSGAADARLKKAHNSLKAQDWKAIFSEAGILANLYGTCYLLLKVDDQVPDCEPVDTSRPNKILGYKFLTTDNCYPHFSHLEYCFELPEIYQVHTHHGHEASVHASRIVVFYGKKRYGQNLHDHHYQHEPFWLASYSALLNYLESQTAALMMLKDASVGVFKFAGLRELLSEASGCAADDKKVTEMIYKRLSGLVDSANIMKKLIIDAEHEDYSFIERNYAGVKEIISDFRDAFLGLSPLPASILFSNSENAGLFSSGNAGDRALLSHMVEQYQNDQLLPAYSQILNILGNFEDLEVTFPSSFSMTPDETNRALFDMTKTLTALVAAKIITPKQAAKRLMGNEFNMTEDELSLIPDEVVEVAQANNSGQNRPTAEALDN